MAKKKICSIQSSTLREIILAQMAHLGVSRHQIAHSGRVNASPTTIFRFLSGQSQSSSSVIEAIMVSLGIDIVIDENFEW